MSRQYAPDPAELLDFLVQSQGWKALDAGLRDRLHVLEHDAYPGRQLVFPMDESVLDYEECISRTIQKLSRLSGTAVPTLLARIQSWRDDVIRLRIASFGNTGTLPLSFAARLIQNTEKLLRSAACTALRPRIFHPRLSLSEVTQFIEGARLAQTERGSFVMNVACPLHTRCDEESVGLDGVYLPFGRRITTALHLSLATLTSAIERDMLDLLVDELKASTAPLISSNLCEALAGMQDDAIDNELDVGFAWSDLYAAPDGLPTANVHFRRDYFSRIEAVRRELRSMADGELGVFIGTVERLDGFIDGSGRRSGEVLLNLLLPDEGEMTMAKITLDADAYEKAITAHKTNGAYVRVIGRLRPGRQPRQLMGVSGFELLDQPVRSDA